MAMLRQKEKQSRVQFVKLSIGETFEIDGAIFMKTSVFASHSNCVCLRGSNGRLTGNSASLEDKLVVKKVEVLFEVVKLWQN